MIDLKEWKDKQFADLISEIVIAVNKHERQLNALQQSIIMGGTTSKLFIDAFTESEDKRV